MGIRTSYSENSADFASSIIVSTNPIVLLGFTVYNSGPAQFIQLFDDTAVPANGEAPILPVPVEADSVFGMYWGEEGRYFPNGLVLCNSSTDSTKTLGSADCWFDVQVRVPSEK